VKFKKPWTYDYKKENLAAGMIEKAQGAGKNLRRS